MGCLRGGVFVFRLKLTFAGGLGIDLVGGNGSKGSGSSNPSSTSSILCCCGGGGGGGGGNRCCSIGCLGGCLVFVFRLKLAGGLGKSKAGGLKNSSSSWVCCCCCGGNSRCCSIGCRGGCPLVFRL